ncbi:MAG TPA: D-2-hydroxyacid dehydrogenase family protein [Gammaproteobacteria bacterium]|nr:D-2-hydroxyacid dehydrogenase family protein [Gammaproteobacteria bacterium]
MRKLAIIDDYERAALEAADWSALQQDVAVTVFHDHLAGEDALAERFADFQIIVIMRERTPFPRSLLARLPNLELLVTSGMRNASIDLAAAKELGVAVTGTPILAYPAAEHAWALILALTKRIAIDDQAMRTGGWGTAANAGLKDKTLGIVGLGRLGSQAAKIGLAFGMRVVAWSENLTDARCAEVGAERVAKDELFRRSDVVTIHLQLSERTRGLVGRRELELMKPSAYLVNTSRGPIVVEQDLVEALKRRTIAGAGLDVFDVEPLPADHALRRLANTVLTPHQGYVTAENFRLFFSSAVENIRAWLDGKIINEVR